MMKKALWRFHERLTHFMGRVTKKYYYEDYVRVYPDGIKFDRFGRRIHEAEVDRNYLNHRKFYVFASQFVKGKRVADVGCGSGYGCKIVKDSGASYVKGFDLSKHSIKFAKEHFSNVADFEIRSITDIHGTPDNSFDVTICSEVMEHIKEYGKQKEAMGELRRITKKDGLIIIGTPNTEWLENHGYEYGEMKELMDENFNQYIIFENALEPIGKGKSLWDQRVASKRTGMVISQNINLDETVILENTIPNIKKGLAPGIVELGPHRIDTSLLHNTHSWVTVSINDRK